MTRIALVEFPADDPERARRFWSGLLGEELRPRTEDEGQGWQSGSAAPPVGVHERYNRRWAREGGAALKQRDARFAAEWLGDMIADGTLAAAAWAGFMRLPKFGLERILDAVGRAPAA
jgi:catechol 2,3-dioxygenase-like lactoylglutathione lyase family enzyme